jgi:hypothetical protein
MNITITTINNNVNETDNTVTETNSKFLENSKQTTETNNSPSAKRKTPLGMVSLQCPSVILQLKRETK